MRAVAQRRRATGPSGVFAIACALAACGGGSGSGEPWVVRVQTDLAPGVELATLRLVGVTSDGRADELAELELRRGDDWSREPLVLATLAPTDVPRDVRAFDVVATDQVGAEVLRDRRPRPRESGVVDVRLTRSCLGVACGGETACLGGRCVPLDCRRGDEASCPPPLCAVAAECEPVEAGCQTFSRCDAGVCFTTIEHWRCPGRQVCELGFGCVTLPGVGLPNGARCGDPSLCASGICEGNVCCAGECSVCETCETGSCLVLPGRAGSEPTAETCDGLDEDCDARIDEGVVTDTLDHCGACGFRCASDESCGGERCVADAACERYLGIPCEELEVATIRSPQPHLARFGETVHVAGDVLAVAVPFDDMPITGIDAAPLEPFFRFGEGDHGAVLIFRRDAGGRADVEAAIRMPSSIPEDRRRSYRFGTHIALSDDALAVAGTLDTAVFLYARDDEGRWAPAGVRDGEARVLALRFLADGALALVRQDRVQGAETDGRMSLDAELRLSRHLATDGRRLAVLTSMHELHVGTRETGLERVASLDPIRDLAFAGERLVFSSVNGLLVFREGAAGWEQEALLEPPEASPRGSGPIAVTEDWIIVGSPSDALTDAPGVGADLRIRTRTGTQGTVYLYARGASGAPLGAPVYLRPLVELEEASFGRAIAAVGNTLYVAATGDDFGHGTVRVLRVGP